MQRIAFTMKIKPGSEEEYRRRHEQVWPEMLADQSLKRVQERVWLLLSPLVEQ